MNTDKNTSFSREKRKGRKEKPIFVFILLLETKRELSFYAPFAFFAAKESAFICIHLWTVFRLKNSLGIQWLRQL